MTIGDFKNPAIRNKRTEKFRAGQMGWDMGDALMIKARVLTRYGYIYVVQLYAQSSELKNKWIEAMTHDRLKEIIGPDCNGEMPKREWFK